ncbi:MAG: DUF3025 domain-containing protein [Burkholderiales bacterium]
MTPWDADFFLRSPMFEPLRNMSAALHVKNWPQLDDLRKLLENSRSPIVNSQGLPIRFVAQTVRAKTFEEKYEPKIYLKGEVPLRAENWHDLLNALVWLTFPKSKAALNRRHFLAARAAAEKGTPNRGKVQDALTLFDEGGVLVACGTPDLTALLKEFEWKELFWKRRNELTGAMKFYLFGHALYEKALQPFTGITGKGVIFEVEQNFFGLTLERQLHLLDIRLTDYLAEEKSFGSTQDLAPIPILGVPGWCADNENEEYYENIRYFRHGRAGA